MADLSVTAANVQQATGSTVVEYIAASAITAGQAVYLDASGQAAPAQHDGTEIQARAVGIAVNSAPGAGQKVSVQTAGNINVGATLSAGTTYIVGAGSGGIAPDVDAGSSDYVTILGVATTTSNMVMGVLASGATR